MDTPGAGLIASPVAKWRVRAATLPARNRVPTSLSLTRKHSHDNLTSVTQLIHVERVELTWCVLHHPSCLHARLGLPLVDPSYPSLPASGSPLPAPSSCLLPLASCLLPLASCLLPLASCLLPQKGPAGPSMEWCLKTQWLVVSQLQRQSSLISHLSSLISHLSSLISHLSSLISHLSLSSLSSLSLSHLSLSLSSLSLISHLSSLVCHPPSPFVEKIVVGPCLLRRAALTQIICLSVHAPPHRCFVQRRLHVAGQELLDEFEPFGE